MNRRGGALIEVMVALVILASAGVSSVSYLVAFLDAANRAEAREHAFARAEKVLTVMALLRAEELDLRLGKRTEDGLVVWTSRPEAGLYRLAVADSLAPEREIVTTVVYRPGGGEERPDEP